MAPPRRRRSVRLRRLRGQRRPGRAGARGYRRRLGGKRRAAARGPRTRGDALVLDPRQREAREDRQGPRRGGNRPNTGSGARDRRRPAGGRRNRAPGRRAEDQASERRRRQGQRPRVPRPRRRQHRLQAERAPRRHARDSDPSCRASPAPCAICPAARRSTTSWRRRRSPR